MDAAVYLLNCVLRAQITNSKDKTTSLFLDDQVVGREEIFVLNAPHPPKGSSPRPQPSNTSWGISQGGRCDREGCSVL